jgi:type II secretory pathway pseudopilin PulG
MRARYQQVKQGWAVGKSDGFTIIEVILFFAISALLAATLLSGWTLTIDTQRYKDSNRRLQSFLQEQYNLVYNVENGRDANLSCIYNGSTLNIGDAPADNTSPGQSNCVVMGRYIYIQNGTKLAVSSIVGLDQVPDSTHSDLQQMQDFKVQRVDSAIGLTRSNLDIPWQATIVGQSGDSTPRSYAIAIIRAPSTGIVHTFTEETPTEVAVSQLINNANEQNPVYFCLDPGVTINSPRTGVMMDALASSQSSVKTVGNAVC